MSVDDLKRIMAHLSQKDIQTIRDRTAILLDIQSAIMKLPPELRNMIFNEVIKSHLNDIEPKDPKERITLRHYMPPLFQTCKQLRSEGTGLLYGKFIRVAGKSSQHQGKAKECSVTGLKNMTLRPLKDCARARICQTKGRARCHTTFHSCPAQSTFFTVYRAIDADNATASCRYYIYTF